jgi:hypothetical protein
VTTRDDELLDVLATSLGSPRDAEPSWAEISQLHRVVDTAAGRGWGGRHGARVWRIRRPLTAAMAGVLVLGSASAAAALSGAVMPQPVRVAARAVGLPVDSPDLAGARAALARLRDALDRRPPDLGAIRALARDARDRVGRLSADDRSKVDEEADFLLGAADAALAPPPAPLGAPPPSPPANPSNAAPAPSGAPGAAPSGDDHGGDSGRAAEPEHSGSGSGDSHSGDNGSGSSANPSGSGTSEQGSSGPGDGDHTATTQRIDNSGDGGGSDGGSSHDGGGSDGGSHSGPG